MGPLIDSWVLRVAVEDLGVPFTVSFFIFTLQIYITRYSTLNAILTPGTSQNFAIAL